MPKPYNVCVFLVSLSLCSKYVFTIESNNSSGETKESMPYKIGLNKSGPDNTNEHTKLPSSTLNEGLLDNDQSQVKSSSRNYENYAVEGGGVTVYKIGLNKSGPDTTNDNTKLPSSTLNKGLLDNDQSQVKSSSRNYDSYAVEGGGVTVLYHSTDTSSNHGEKNILDDESHSKGRKGVGNPGTSVVPRKGVDGLLDPLINKPIYSENIKNDANKSSVSSDKFSAQLSLVTEISKNKSHTSSPLVEDATEVHVVKKKPEFATDSGDGDEYDSYTVIKPSSTGEDYVIIGIAIVIGIWFAVFGGLLFYRRAGDYWDRRHYRRMDFLVEGMYND